VVGHQAVGVNPPVKPIAHVPEQHQKFPAIVLGKIDVFTPITA